MAAAVAVQLHRRLLQVRAVTLKLNQRVPHTVSWMSPPCTSHFIPPRNCFPNFGDKASVCGILANSDLSGSLIYRPSKDRPLTT